MHRPIVLGIGAASVIVAVLMFPLLNTELAPQTDEGVVSVSAELAAGTRIERTDAIMSRLEQMTRQLVPEAQTIIASAGSGGGGGVVAAWAAAERAAASFSSSWCRRMSASDPAIRSRSICGVSCRASPA